jgi:hypothetical protein
MIAYAILQARRLTQAEGEKESPGYRHNQLCPP